MNVGLLALALFFIVATGLPLLSADHWTIRFFDFPRVQIAVGAGTVLGAYAVVVPDHPLGYAAMVLLAMCCVYQFDRILPYTLLSRRQVRRVEHQEEDEQLRVLIANVEVENRDAESLLEQIEETQPDVVFAVETDEWWADKLSTLEDEYPHVITYPQENAYGMCLWSRRPLIDPSVRFIVEDHVPSIHTQVELPSGRRVTLHGMHPRPPHPNHKPDTTERDAELLLLAREIKDRDVPTVVVGDLNDVSWSYTTQLFQKISGLLDPRVGRGTYNTFHARYPLFRYPLDHAFHSDHFKLVKLEVLPYIGSDHFPVLLELQYAPEGPDEQPRPEADEVDEEQARHEIDKMKEKAASEGERG